MAPVASHVVTQEEAKTLDGLFAARVKRTPDAVAYREFNAEHGNWREYTWAQIDRQVARWQAALAKEGLAPGDRVAIMLRNSPEWVIYDQAALGLALVDVPLYTQDRPDNVAYIVGNAGCKVLLIENAEQWKALAPLKENLKTLVRIVALKPVSDPSEPRLTTADAWLPDDGGETKHLPRDPQALASIVYTSGTTGRPKGVMLSHNNILSNAAASITVLAPTADDIFLSFLPLSHTLERTGGYYLTVMTGAQVAFARSIPQLGEDLQTVRPTILVSVPRIYERVYNAIRAKLDDGPPLRKKLFELAVEVGYARFEHAQGRGSWKPSFLLWPLLNALVAKKILARLGGRMKVAISGGAALPPDISRVFLGLGLHVLQGYGLTETSPVISANRLDDNLPASVGRPVPGVEVKLGDKDALLCKGPNVMLGYWGNEEATRAMIGPDGWLNTGDTARIDAGGHIFITGRIKDIIVMSNGEKIPPADMEAAIARDPLFEQILLIGEGKPFLSAIVVINADHWRKAAEQGGLAPELRDDLRGKPAQQLALARIGAQLKEFPGYAQVRRVTMTFEPWTVENGLLTPTMKLKRAKVLEKFNAELDRMYEGRN
jgi:long-chain acyl-CoA synthetase